MLLCVCVCQLKIQCEDAMLHNSQTKEVRSAHLSPYNKIHSNLCVNAIMSSIKQYEDAYASKDVFQRKFGLGYQKNV